MIIDTLPQEDLDTVPEVDTLPEVEIQFHK